jgi:hypothetical protein
MREKRLKRCDAPPLPEEVCRPQRASKGKENSAPCHFQYIERRGACGKARVMAHHRRLKQELTEMEGTK